LLRGVHAEMRSPRYIRERSICQASVAVAGLRAVVLALHDYAFGDVA